jgi:hypothetical protein
VVPPAGTVAAVGCGQQCGDLVVGEIGDQRGFVSFRGDREDLSDQACVLRVQRRGEDEQRMDRREADIAGRRGAFPPVFQVVEEVADQRRGDAGDVQVGRLDAGTLGYEPQQQSPSVAVGIDGVRAGVKLPGQSFGEERLQGGGQRGHDCRPARRCSRRSATNPNNSGEPVRYQLSRCRDNWYYSDSRVIPMPAASCA